MNYRILGKTGLRISVIGFGGIPIQRIPADKAMDVVNKALEQGINFFDTARGYTDSEAKLGAALKNRRAEIIIATKSMARNREGMYADIHKSLETLGVDYIDLYQLHNVKDKAALEQILSPDGALAALIEAKKEGLVRHIGITGHIKEFLLEALQTGELETVQFPFNIVETNGAQELLDLAQKNNLGTIVMKPLAGGALKDVDLSLRYILEHPVTAVIPGMDAVEQVEANVRTGQNLLPLSAEERQALEEEAGKLGASFCRRCEYCQPCAQGIDIPTVFLLDGYYTRYGLKTWARERYNGITGADACIECGECEEKCPYSLPIRQMLADARTRLAE